MEKNCFAFKENQHNHCSCTVLSEMICAKENDCAFYQHKNKVDPQKIKKDIKKYAKKTH